MNHLHHRERVIDHIPFGEVIDFTTRTRPNQYAYRNEELNLTLHGLLGALVWRVTVDLVIPGNIRQDGKDEFVVQVWIKLPDRDRPKQWTDITARAHHVAEQEWLDAGLNPHQAVAYQQLLWVWMHEFKEGVKFNGQFTQYP